MNCAALPSGTSALRLVQGDVGALPLVLTHLALRASLIGLGMYMVGMRQNVARYALGGSLGIEAFVLGWAAWQSYTPAPAEQLPAA